MKLYIEKTAQTSVCAVQRKLCTLTINNLELLLSFHFDSITKVLDELENGLSW